LSVNTNEEEKAQLLQKHRDLTVTKRRRIFSIETLLLTFNERRKKTKRNDWIKTRRRRRRTNVFFQ